MWKMSICCNARWRQTDRLAANLCNVFWEAGPSPSGAVIYLSYLQCIERWGEERWHRLSRPEGTGLLLRDRKYNWAALTRGSGTNQTFLAPSFSHPHGSQTQLREAVLAFQALSRDNQNKTCHLCLQWHLFDRGRFFFPSSPQAHSLAFCHHVSLWPEL